MRQEKLTVLPANEQEEIGTSELPERKKSNFFNPIREIIQFILIAALVVVPIRWFVAQPFIVSGASMEETFQSGEYLIVDQLTYRFNDPKRGDIVVFRYPRDPSKFFIKRVIGLPGDRVEISGTTITIYNDEYRSGMVLDEHYVKSMDPVLSPISESLSDREYYVLGDNRDQSSDSRNWGMLQEENIMGRALLRLFPIQRIDLFPGKIDLDKNEAKEALIYKPI